MRFFPEYLKQCRRTIALFMFFSVIFCASFALYRLPLAAVVYPFLLCFMFGSIFMITGYVRTRKKTDRIRRAGILADNIANSMPEAETLAEKYYKDAVSRLEQNASTLVNQTSARYNGMIEYYTVWAHQIKTPITSMRLTLQNEDTQVSRRLSSDLFQIEQYVEMVMAFLRLESSSTDYVFRKYKLDDIVRRSASKFAAEFIARRIKLDIKGPFKEAVTDEKWLSFVIEQVLSNALKYTPAGTIKIYMREPMELCVEDTGVGIAPEDLPRIFEKGYTGYNGRLEGSSSGIGLYLCKKICGNIGVSLKVDSTPGIGTTVRLGFDGKE